MGSNHQETLLTMHLKLSPTIHQGTTLKNLFALISSIEPITAKRIHSKIHTDKNENISYNLQQPHKEKDITFVILHLIESMIKICAFKENFQRTTYNQINEKFSCITIMHFNIPERLNIHRNFRTILSPAPDILYKTKLSQYTQLHTITLHPISCTSTYGNISSSYLAYSKIDFIKSDHFSHCSNQKQVDSHINSKSMCPRKRWTSYLTTKSIYYFYSLLVIFEYFLLESNMWTLVRKQYILIHGTAQVPYYFYLPSFQLLPNQKSQVSVRVLYSVLPTQDSFEKISNYIACVNSYLQFLPSLYFKLQIRNHHFDPKYPTG